MFSHWFEKLGEVFERAEHHRRDTYLASSVDIADLDRRMRSVDAEGFPFADGSAFGPHAAQMPHDRSA